MALFDGLKSAPKKSKTRGKGLEIPQTVAFVRALASNAPPIRLTYAALAVASVQLGEHTANGMSDGQRGGSLCQRGLPSDLQPFVCKSGGGYAKGTEWPETDVTPDDMKGLGHVMPNDIGSYVSAFTAHQGSETVETEQDANDADLDEIEDDFEDEDDEISSILNDDD